MRDLGIKSGFNYIQNEKTFDVSAFVTVYMFDKKPDLSPCWEEYVFSQIFLVLEGKGTYITEEQEYPVESGMMFYRPAGKRSSYAWTSEKVRFGLISFVCHSPAMDEIGVKPIHLHEEEIVTLLDVIKTAYKIFESLKDDAVVNGMKVKDNVPNAALSFIYASLERFLCMIYCRLNHIFFIMDETQKVNRYIDNSKLVEAVKEYLSKHISEQLTMNDICTYFGMSQSGLMKKFRKEVDQGVMEYFTGLKIEEAKKRMQKTSASFTEIAESLGFSSVNYFSKVFKAKTNVTPTEYSKYISKRRLSQEV